MGNLLVPFKKFLSNKNTVTILGVLIGIVVLYFGYNWRVNQSTQPMEIPYCNQTLKAGQKITEDYISYTKIPKSAISDMTNLVVDANQIRGKLVSYDSKIAKNGFFYQENLITEEQMPDSIFTDIPDGYTVFKLKVNNETTYFNSIFPDDEIDLYLHLDLQDAGSNEKKVVYGRLIKQIQVLAVKDGDGKNVFADKDNPTESEGLLFAVPEDLYLLLSKATYLGFDIVPVPRNSSYSAEAAATEKTSEELESMIISKTYILQNECKDLTVCG